MTSPPPAPGWIFASFLLGAVLAAAPGDVRPRNPSLVHAEAPPPGHTGGFGEPTCVTCHAGFPENEAGSELTLHGLPDRYRPGERYAVSVVLQVPETVLAGFQLSARTQDGTQAGRFEPVDPRTTVTTGEDGAVAYVHNTLVGAEVGLGEVATWMLDWVAPSTSVGAVHFHLAANSANGDNSPFGDLVYRASARIPSSG